MKLILTLCLAFGFAATSFCQGIHGATTNDPVAHFRSIYAMNTVQKMFKLEADINNDGRADVFIGTIDVDPDTGQVDEEDEIGWFLYIARQTGDYILAGQKVENGSIVDSAPSFKKDQYKIGFIPEITGYGLLHLSCGRGGQAKCQLKAIVIDGDAWKEIPIGELVNAEQNYDQLAERFTDPPTPAVQELNP